MKLSNEAERRYRLSLDGKALVDQHVAAARKTISEEWAEAAWADRARLSLAQAVAEALRASP